MPVISAILLGSISTVVDTSELQRRAFNEAFSRHGLDWEWDRDRYVAMLESNGGRDRIAEYARTVGESVDADAVHTTKSSVFQELLALLRHARRVPAWPRRSGPRTSRACASGS